LNGETAQPGDSHRKARRTAFRRRADGIPETR